MNRTNNRKRLIIISGIVISVLLSSALYLYCHKTGSGSGDRAVNNSPIIIHGKSFDISEDEIVQIAEKYRQMGYNNLEESAIKHLIKRKVLLNKAVEMGYSVTEEDVDQHITQVKEALKASENYNDYLEVMEDYGGEDAYWADIRDTTRDTMIINKYIDYEKERYKLENTDKQEVQFDSTLWNKQEAEIVNNLVKEQEIMILDGRYDNLKLEW